MSRIENAEFHAARNECDLVLANDNYVVANTSDECRNGAGHFRGFLLRQGKYIAIDFPGSNDTQANAINDDGVIVGVYFDKQGVSHGFKAVPTAEQRIGQ